MPSEVPLCWEPSAVKQTERSDSASQVTGPANTRGGLKPAFGAGGQLQTPLAAYLYLRRVWDLLSK